ncbi:hypothetical protein LOTGIDRAFT_173320 [Lottia gigantea]|uniref:Uncharacterized protein n=1 Tax=Lottia gigantea TaxID=225164 RepID=V4AYQ1_LOTGI|nr:hypothetical protein LOTGIDRAFT_173320 [Lottia gigantea]ESP00296.1 hypothetical protein LOTGIDRAFT_173320 [Lottia gigantea]
MCGPSGIPVLFHHNQHSNNIVIQTKSLYHQALDLVKYEVVSLGSHNYIQIHIGEATKTTSSTSKIFLFIVLSMLLLVFFVVLKEIKGSLFNFKGCFETKKKQRHGYLCDN